jgi:hypothetical protein
MFDLSGRVLNEMQLLEHNHTAPILEAQFWGNGVAVLTSNFMIRVAEVT